MVTKRAIFEQLTAEELRVIVDQYALDVEDRRARGVMVDAIVASRKVDVAASLADLSRERLKEICRKLDVDDSGRDKATLVTRLLGASASKVNGTTPSNGVNGASTHGASEAAILVDIAPDQKLTVEQLERYLWSAADILRGSIDSSDYKSFIFGLLFLKRLSDRFEEECDALVADRLDPEDKDEHQFFVPKRARWPEIQRTVNDLGGTLNKACSALENENPSLEGVLAGIDFNDERKLGDARNRDVVLSRLVQHFSKVKLGNASLSEPDMLGRAYEYLIEKFADDAGKKGGEFYTPKKVVELMVELLAPTEKMRICDPTCGSGGMLIECANYLRRSGKNPRNLSLSGQEKNLGTWAICKMNMLLHGLPDAKIEKGDTIRDPKLRDGEGLALFSRVIANPPFSLDEWGREVAENDPYGRFRYGIPPNTKGDLAFVQHMIATTERNGMVGVVMPHGVLFRGANEGEIRKGLLQDDLIEAVVGLPVNLFYGTGIPTAILVLNKSKPANRRNRVLFVEASREFGSRTTQNVLRDEDVKRIVEAFRAFADIEKYARVVGFDEIAKNEFNLNISRYMDTAPVVEAIDVETAVLQLRQAQRARDAAGAKLEALLKELGYAG